MIEPVEATPTTKAPPANSVLSFIKSLDKIQEHQIVFTAKLEKERKRKEELEESLNLARRQRRELQDLTRNGSIVNEDEKMNKIIINKLEKRLQSAKIKLSISRRDNIGLKTRVDSLRKDKRLHMQIKSDMEKEISDNSRRIKHVQREMASINNKKHQTKVAIANAKHSIVRDMTDFSRELAATKENLTATQTVMFGTIRDRLHATFELAAQNRSGKRVVRTPEGLGGEHSKSKDELDLLQSQLQDILRGKDMRSVADLVADVELAEEQIFTVYNEIQEKNEELEKIDLENKHLEQQLSDRMSKLDALEKHNSRVRLELEQHISQIQKSIAKYDAEYAKSTEVLQSISDSLLNLLKNVAIDGEALDQQLLSTGITDRNINDFLGIIEQRIDDLMQMSNAANHNPLQREDFLRLAAAEHRLYGGNVLRAPATLPSLQDADDDEDIIPVGTLTSAAHAATAASREGGPVGFGAQPALDETNRVQPININLLKDYMAKKMQKALGKKVPAPPPVAPSSPSFADTKGSGRGMMSTKRPADLSTTSPLTIDDGGGSMDTR